MASRVAGVALTTLLTACSGGPDESVTTRQAIVDYDLLENLRPEPFGFEDNVLPVLERRCAVCHGCFDAPCQLKLTVYEGIVRGANPKKVYDGARIRADEPTRLFIDARSTAGWRAKGFHPVLNEGSQEAVANLQDSVLYRMLRLKQLNPQPRRGMIPDSVTLELDRKQSCPTLDEFDSFASDHPLWGMPYAMPNLTEDEYATLVRWLAQGAPPPAWKPVSPEARPLVDAWENFLNGRSDRERLMSRYIYEHLFLGHIHFTGTGDREFYRLIRSTTPPGEPPDEIATRRPYNDPGTDTFFYRLLRYQPSIVAKSHVVYEAGSDRLERFRELFLAPEYTVAALPDYDPKKSANPFITFRDLPAQSRYRFLLDDARFFIEGFIKGPVCRGQVALNVIEDQFWVVFFDPDNVRQLVPGGFLDRVAEDLVVPSERGSTLNLFAIWTDYRKKQRDYLAAKQELFKSVGQLTLDEAMLKIWDGDGSNRSAALTIFRDYDSADVEYGLLGDYPETAWVIDYPLLERIHYLLVAGFDVYGNVGHQLNTRLFMDFLRMEGEDYFLLFLPPADRAEIRDAWYEGLRSRRKKLLTETSNWMTEEIVVGYQTDDPQRELYQHIEQRLGAVAGPVDFLNRCTGNNCASVANTESGREADIAMQRLATLRGETLQAFPDVAFVRVTDAAGPGADVAYTIILNKGYKDLTSIFEDENNRRNFDDDTLTIVKGLIGSYPNFFFAVPADGIDDFVDGMMGISNRDDYERMVARFGIRRTNPAFWDHADWFQQEFATARPVEAGLFDLNRYENR